MDASRRSIRPTTWPSFTFAFIVLLFSSPLLSAPNELADLAERAKHSVVLLTTQDGTGQKSGTGTGFFVSSDGLIVTNHHVIEGASAVTATLSDGQKRVVAGLVADNEAKDIAILRVDAQDLPALQLGDSSRIKPGDEVVVLGSPRGLSGTLSVGIVSAIRERGAAEEDDPEREKLGSWGIQISAAISPGSSGSPIMTRGGEVVAVAVGTFTQGQNLNFGVPIEVTKTMLATLGPSPKTTPFARSTTNDLRQNLLISAGILSALIIVFVVWGRMEKRGGKGRRISRGN